MCGRTCWFATEDPVDVRLDAGAVLRSAFLSRVAACCPILSACAPEKTNKNNGILNFSKSTPELARIPAILDGHRASVVNVGKLWWYQFRIAALLGGRRSRFEFATFSHATRRVIVCEKWPRLFEQPSPSYKRTPCRLQNVQSFH